MQLRKIAHIFSKKTLKNVPCANIRNCVWLGVVIELKRVINELTHKT